MRTLNTLLLIFFSLALTYAQNVQKTKTPKWVVNTDFKDDNSNLATGGFQYLLQDSQDNLVLANQYVHYAVKILNGEGIQEMSDISTSFDPAYQSLEFHTVRVFRNGEIINKLPNTTINTYQRETNLERALYDGSITAVINLTDIRVGDIIEYAYSIKGFNPASEGNYSTMLFQEYHIPVNKIYSRIITSKDNALHYKLFSNAKKPKELETVYGKEYIWDNDGTNYVNYDTNVPIWYNKQKRVSVSTFANWEKVVELIQPLYDVNKHKLDFPVSINPKEDSKEESILKLVRFVQDEVRYLGFESGIAAYRPNSPSTVLNRRYGDCKDKSLLLSSLLRNLGVESYPLLVNSSNSKHLDQLLPSHYLFDHCIVYLKHEDREYVIDPTISNQGGDLSRMATPDYKFGLLLKSGSDNLLNLKKEQRQSLTITEDIEMDSIGGSATFTIKSEYTGNKADYMRAYFKSTSKEAIKKEYLNYYSALYPSISMNGEVILIDDSRSWENIVTTRESYTIDAPWTTTDTDQGYSLESYALVLESMVSYAKSAKREMPYYLGEPFNFLQTTRIALPEPWPVPKENINIDDESFTYKRNTSTIGNLVTISHSYNLKKSYIEGKDTPSFLKKQERVRNHLGYQLTYNTNLRSNNDALSLRSVLIALITFSLCLFVAFRLYKDYNPDYEGSQETQALGGWLVLPAIGLFLTPFVMLFQLFSTGYFDKSIWNGFELGGYEHYNELNVFLGFELFSVIFFIVFSVLLLVLFFRKRTSFPILIIYFYAINLTTMIFSSFVLNKYGVPDPTAAQDIFKAVLSAAIWIPYFLKSNRVKNTFGNTFYESRKVASTKALPRKEQFR